MRCVWATFTFLALSSAATADECKIIWWDLFLPQSEVKFEKTSEVSALLTLTNTTKLEPISFELAFRTLTRENGANLDVLIGSKTLVAEGLSNEVTVSLQPKSSSWLVGFESKQVLRTKDGRNFGGESLLSGYLICNQLKP